MNLSIERYSPTLLLSFAKLYPPIMHKFLAQWYKPLILPIGLEHPNWFFEITYVSVCCTICSTTRDFLWSSLNTTSTSLLSSFSCTWIIIRVRLSKEFLARIASHLNWLIVNALIIHTYRFIGNKAVNYVLVFSWLMIVVTIF